MNQKQKENIASQQWNGEEYAQRADLHVQFAAQHLMDLNLRGDEHVLDLGCGDGSVSKYIARECVPQGNVLGLDSSKSMIAYAKKINSDCKNLEFEAIGCCTHADHEPFDHVTSFNVLQWIEDQVPILSHVYSILNRGGKILFTVGAAGSNPEMSEIRTQLSLKEPFKEFTQDLVDEKWIWPQEQAPFQTLLKLIGFQNISVEIKTHTYIYESRNDLLQTYAAVLPHLDALPFELQGQFMNELIDEYVARITPREDGKFYREYAYLLVRGSK